jgi:uncharacterized protein YjiK
MCHTASSRQQDRPRRRGAWDRNVFCLLVLLLGALAVRAQDAPATAHRAPYAFDQPDRIIWLPSALHEISGVAVLREGLLGAVQDEAGDLFLLDAETGEVVARRNFGPPGDYEDLALVGERIFVLRSDGTLFEISDWQADSLTARIHATRLTERHNTEGLAYDPRGRRLLIACKDYPGEGLRRARAIYAWDLEGQQRSGPPVYVIEGQAFNEAAPDHPINRTLRKLLAPVADLSGLRPSALAVHPVTDELYVLSSERKALVILHRSGSLLGVWELPRTLYPAPEGLAFLPNGDLLISNEGDLGAPTLLRYRYRPQ